MFFLEFLFILFRGGMQNFKTIRHALLWFKVRWQDKKRRKKKNNEKKLASADGVSSFLGLCTRDSRPPIDTSGKFSGTHVCRLAFKHLPQSLKTHIWNQNSPFHLVSMGGRVEVLMCADPGARTPIRMIQETGYGLI
jgi:hypothetical protein